jgi:hypothetical protein
MSDSTHHKGKAKNLVLTPMGWRPKDSVVHVRPGEVVRRKKDGTLIVEKPSAVSTEGHKKQRKKKR